MAFIVGGEAYDEDDTLHAPYGETHPGRDYLRKTL